MNLEFRLIAATACVALAIMFIGDIAWGSHGLPYSRECGVAGLLFTAALLTGILRAGRRRRAN
jgi:hypothetical protein